MIIWRGKGGLVVLSVFLGVYITTVIFGLLPVDTSYRAGYILQGIVGVGLATLFNYLFTKKFVSDTLKTFIDEETGERIQIKDGSSLFFIPNKYWTWLILTIGIFIVIGSSSIYD
ncbi:hypothetical protein [Isobaculum melis]|uniref:Uncharacterized protein n=1 Tax=Isobaculum melis TaxID=142588 RepID=A0A1H9R5Q8_9LACT|nr:hypothetical protein [Isobaculum melis]SER67273.1 hypothetical protein SAMN04488559_10334 [Isobaculum melis]